MCRKCIIPLWNVLKYKYKVALLLTYYTYLSNLFMYDKFIYLCKLVIFADLESSF